MNSLVKLTVKTWLSLIIFSGFSLHLQASIDVYEFQDEATREEFVALTKELRCPKCQNQDIADSNAPIAKDMRAEVHRLLQEGQDKDSIVQHMIDRFGDFVSYKPKVSAETFMLWYGPWIFILAGLVLIASLIRLKKPGAGKQAVEQAEDGKPGVAASNADGSGGKKNAVYSSEVKKILDKYDDEDTGKP